jgi:hypothetical protein
MKQHWRNLAAIFPASIERKVYANFFQKEHQKWLAQGKSLPPSHFQKQQALLATARKFGLDYLVETGTYMGDMVFALQPYFKKIYSIELSPKFYEAAKKRFHNTDNVSIVQGDSAEKLKEIVQELQAPALFWLDGHYSGGETAMGAKECPVYEELEAIFTSTLDHVIIIDDARLFVGKNDYPTVEELSAFVDRAKPGARLFIENDGVHIYYGKNS